jgi:hypothetical protein
MGSMAKPARTTARANLKIKLPPTILASILFASLGCALYASGEVWKTKPYTQWDEKDVAEILHSSPWVKLNLPDLGSAQLSTAPVDNGPLGAGAPATGRTNPATATVAPKPDNSEGPAAGGESKTYNVFWWSARTIREALVQQAVLRHQATPESGERSLAAIPDTYQILVSAPNMTTIEAHGPEALKDGAFIELKKSKRKIKPTDVVFQRASGKVIGAVFSFPKKDANGAPEIEPDEKQIEFNLRAPGIWLRASFNPKQMSDMQGPDF